MAYHIDTKCVQAGYDPKNGEARVVPIVQSTTFKYDSAATLGKLFDLEEDGFFYTRLTNPTLSAVAAKIAALEGGVGAMLTASGQSASMISITNICHAGDHVVCASAIYGGTFNLFNKSLREMGIDFTFVTPDSTEEQINVAFQENTRAVFVESVSNPSLDVADVELYAKLAHAHGVPLWIIRSRHPLISDRLSGVRISLYIQLQNIWTVMLLHWAELSLTAETLTGQTENILHLQSLMNLIMGLSIQRNSARLPISQRQLLT